MRHKDKFGRAPRINFLSYPFCFRKFCEIAGYDDYINFFQVPKGNDKLKYHEAVFEEICKDLGWSYRSSDTSRARPVTTVFAQRNTLAPKIPKPSALASVSKETPAKGLLTELIQGESAEETKTPKRKRAVRDETKSSKPSKPSKASKPEKPEKPVKRRRIQSATLTSMVKMTPLASLAPLTPLELVAQLAV